MATAKPKKKGRVSPNVPRAGLSKSGSRYACGGNKMACGGRKKRK